MEHHPLEISALVHVSGLWQNCLMDGDHDNQWKRGDAVWIFHLRHQNILVLVQPVINSNGLVLHSLQK